MTLSKLQNILLNFYSTIVDDTKKKDFRYVKIEQHTQNWLWPQIPMEGFFSAINKSTQLPRIQVDAPIQWNLSVANMLYSGHLSIADTFSKHQLSPAMVKPLHVEPLYSGHFFRVPMVSAIEIFYCIRECKFLE